MEQSSKVRVGPLDDDVVCTDNSSEPKGKLPKTVDADLR